MITNCFGFKISADESNTFYFFLRDGGEDKNIRTGDFSTRVSWYPHILQTVVKSIPYWNIHVTLAKMAYLWHKNGFRCISRIKYSQKENGSITSCILKKDRLSQESPLTYVHFNLSNVLKDMRESAIAVANRRYMLLDCQTCYSFCWRKWIRGIYYSPE